MGLFGIIVLIAVIVLLIALVTFVVFSIMRRSQKAVTDLGDRRTDPDRPVAVDDEGRPVTAAQEGGEPAPHDDAAFEAVLKAELEELGRREQ
jgi:heme exporter protein D